MKPGVNGKILLVVDTDGRKDVERRTFSFMFEHQVEGIIYSKWVHGSITPPDELGRMPSVLVNCYDECGRFPAVVPDEVQGGATATRLLLEAGHRRIAFVNDAAPRHPLRLAVLRDTRPRLRGSTSISTLRWCCP